MQMAERVERHDRTEGAAADTEYDKILEFTSNVFRCFQDIRNDFFLVVGELRPTHIQFVLATVFLYVFKRCVGFGRIGRKLLVGKALVAQKFFGHIVVVERNAHGITPISGFVAHKNLLTIYLPFYCTLSWIQCQGYRKIFLGENGKK